MLQPAIRTLENSLRPHLGLSKSRLETLCLLVVGMVSARTVNLSHIACERPGEALIASTYRRLQRFFQDVRLERDWTLPLVATLLGSHRRWTLVLDRTQWSIGRREVNYLVLAVVTRQFRAPLLWTLLPRGGNSSTAARIDLIRRYLAHFPASTVDKLLADREFVGADWLRFLNENNIPFAIRLLRVTCASSARTAASSPSSPACASVESLKPSAAASGRTATATGRSSTSPPSASKASG